MDEGYAEYFSSAVNTAKRAKKRRAKKRAAAKKVAASKPASKSKTSKPSLGHPSFAGSNTKPYNVQPQKKKNVTSSKEPRKAGPSVGRSQRRPKSLYRGRGAY
jgi:hypothetical protein